MDDEEKHVARGDAHLRWEGRLYLRKCLALLAQLALLQDSSGNCRVFQGCQRMPLALLKCRKRRNRTEARQGREERSEKLSEKYLAHLAHHEKTLEFTAVFVVEVVCHLAHHGQHNLAQHAGGQRSRVSRWFRSRNDESRNGKECQAKKKCAQCAKRLYPWNLWEIPRGFCVFFQRYTLGLWNLWGISRGF